MANDNNKKEPNINILYDLWMKDTKYKEKNMATDMLPKQMIENFKDTTTIHGVRHVFGVDRSSCQRLCWTVLVLTCLCLSVFNINDRITYYWTYPKAVNVEVHYNDTLVFPAVTICNQNVFKRTKAVKHGQDGAIYKIYSESKKRVTGKINHMSMEDLFRMNAHDKTDMIISCSWRGQSCSSDNFTDILTSYGLCYTFNGKERKTPLIIESAGKSSGLELIINVEEYDYMIGPNSGAGIKLVLHGQDEIPIPAEYGQELPTGREGFINVEMSRISYLPAPHGKCQPNSLSIFKNYTYTVKSCMLDCWRRKVINVCKCREIDTPVVPGIPACTVRQYTKCVKKTQVKLALRGTCGNCTVPCDITKYKSSISYGSISGFSKNKANIVRMKSLQSNFYNAREKAFLVEEDFVLLSALKDQLLELMPNVTAKLKYLTDRSEKEKRCITEINNVVHFHGKYIIRDLVKNLEVYKRYPKFKAKLDSGPVGIPYDRLSDVLWSFINTVSRLTKAKVKDENFKSDANITKAYLNNMLLSAKNLLSYESEIPWLQKQYVNIWLAGFEHDEDKHIPHGTIYHKDKVITNEIFKYTRNVVEILNSVDKSINNFIENLNYFNRTKFFSDITYLYYNLTVFENRTSDIDEFYEEYVKRNFFHLSLILEDQMAVMTDTLQSQLLNCDVHEFISGILEFSKNLTMSTSKLTGYVSRQKGTMRDMQDFFMGEGTKLMLDRIHSFGISSLGSTAKEQYSEVCFMNILMAYQELMHWILLVYPYIPNTGIKQGVCYKTSNATLHQLYTTEVNEMHWITLVKIITEIRQIMRNYMSTLRMDKDFYSDNFIHLNILFHELSYEEVSQQKAYDILALLGDIGGYLGLFIGASFLSVFEAIDLLYMLFTGWLKSKRKQEDKPSEKNDTSVEELNIYSVT